VGGYFNNADGIANADRIARWDGSNWNALGPSGLNGSVYAIAVAGTDVYVGGDFTNAGGDTYADKIARWDGMDWNALYPGLNSKVYAIAAVGSNVYVGGEFTKNPSDASADYDYFALWGGSSRCGYLYLPLVMRK